MYIFYVHLSEIWYFSITIFFGFEGGGGPELPLLLAHAHSITTEQFSTTIKNNMTAAKNFSSVMSVREEKF